MHRKFLRTLILVYGLINHQGDASQYPNEPFPRDIHSGSVVEPVSVSGASPAAGGGWWSKSSLDMTRRSKA